MGLQSCLIYFDNQSNTYYAGQTVNGRVDCVLDSPKKVRGIKIQIVGEARTHWTETESETGRDGKSHSTTVTYSGVEEYFRIEYYLAGGQSSDEIELPSGQTSYPFTCLLPPSLPSSFEGEHGHVRYTVKVTLDRPWKFDQETKVAFTVISLLDLNTMPHLKDPYKLEKQKTFCCCCCESKPMTLVFNLPCTGFVPGQKLPIIAEIDNGSDVTVQELKYELYKNVVFHSQMPHSYNRKQLLISKISYGPVLSGGESRTAKHEIEIPSLPPSNLTNCGIIDVDYALEITGEIIGFHTNVNVTIPITIGNIPFVSYTAPSIFNIPATLIEENTNQPLLSGTTTDVKTIGWATPIQQSGDSAYPPYPSHKEILPPTISPPMYAESQFGTKTIQDERDNQFTCFGYNSQGYAPRYPVYGYNPSAPPTTP